MNKDTIMNKHIVRIPRPTGATEAGKKYHHDQSPQNKENLINLIIQHYNRNNFTYCQRFYNVEQLSQLLKVPQHIILQGTIEYGHMLRDNMDQGMGNEAMRAIWSLTLQNCLEDRGRAIEHVQTMVSSQGGVYKPFISSEVTKALKLVLESNAQTANMLQGLMKSSAPNMAILVPNEAPQSQVPQGALSVDQVVMQLKALGVPTLAQDLGAQGHIYDIHGIADTPEVGARLQTGIDTSKEALTLNRITKLQDIEGTHINRRAEELGIDDDEI